MGKRLLLGQFLEVSQDALLDPVLVEWRVGGDVAIEPKRVREDHWQTKQTNKQTTNQPIKQPTKQSINQKNKQSINKQTCYPPTLLLLSERQSYNNSPRSGRSSM
jgi:hypothetical protein